MHTDILDHRVVHQALEKPAARKIGFVQACWHREIVDQCRLGFLKSMEEARWPAGKIDFFEVPGAFEIPLYTKELARSGRYAAIVAAALVVDGGIYRHEFVAHAVIDGLMNVQLNTDVPVFSAVLTPHHFHNSAEHLEFFCNHFAVKGHEVAHACIDMVSKLETLKTSSDHAR